MSVWKVRKLRQVEEVLANNPQGSKDQGLIKWLLIRVMGARLIDEQVLSDNALTD